MTIYSERYSEILKEQIKILKIQEKLTKLQSNPKTSIAESEYKEKMDYYNIYLEKLEEEKNNSYISRFFINGKPLG